MNSDPCGECRARPRTAGGAPCEECSAEICAMNDDHLREQADPGWVLVFTNGEDLWPVAWSESVDHADDVLDVVDAPDAPKGAGLWLWSGATLWTGGDGEYPDEGSILCWGEWRKVEAADVAGLAKPPGPTCTARPRPSTSRPDGQCLRHWDRSFRWVDRGVACEVARG